jgi:acyl carrier protein
LESLEVTRNIVRACLQLGSLAESFDRDTQLLGGMPEFNSLTIAAIVASIEDELDCEIDDADITGEMFETMGSLSDFVAEKMEEA